MAQIDVNGLSIAYELLGPEGAPAVAISPGGRFSKDAPGISELGKALAAGGKRVLLWDRPNCGASDMSFDGESEGKIQAAALCGLIRQLGLGPTALVGGSAGVRTSLLAALHDPAVASHLALWWVSGGVASLMMMGAGYCSEVAIAASLGGMEAVAAMPMFKEQLARNPHNRGIILAQDVEEFIAKMERWAAGYVPAEPLAVPGISRAEFGSLKLPVLIFNNHPRDFFHRSPITGWLHEAIPGSTLVELPWEGDEFAACMKLAIANGSGTGHFIHWCDLAPQILAFLED